MKVLHVIPSISPLRGGPSIAVMAMVAALRRQGVDASILTTNDHGPDIDHSMPIGCWFDRAGVPVLAFSRWSPYLRFLREFAISPGLNRWLMVHLREYDLLHVHALFSWPSTTAMIQARRSGVPYILRTIGQLNEWSMRQSAWRKRLLWNLVEKNNLSDAAALHFTAEDERMQASSLRLPTSSLVIPLGVELPQAIETNLSKPFSRKQVDHSVTTFLFLSRIHPKKQIECLIKALALLDRRLPRANWQLRIAGNGEPAYLQSLRLLIDRSGLNDRVKWLGFLQGQPKWLELVRADWFVLPSASENFGISAIEALAAGTPVILSRDVAVSVEINSVGAGLICPTDPQGLSLVLENALTPPSLEVRSAAQSLAASRFGWLKIASQLSDAYRDLAPSKAVS